MLIGGETPPGLPVPDASIIDAAQQMLDQCQGSWGQLLRHILGMARQETGAGGATAANEECVQELLVLQRENRRLSQELIEAKDKIISLLERNGPAHPDKMGQTVVTPLSVPGSGRSMTS